MGDPPATPAPSAHVKKLWKTAKYVWKQLKFGDDPSLPSSELFAAANGARELSEVANRLVKDPTAQIGVLWGEAQDDAAALVAMLVIALRRSTPHGDGGGVGPLYADIRHNLSMVCAALYEYTPAWRRHCEDFLRPALHSTDTLKCYSRLLAEYAEQIRPAAVLSATPGASGEAGHVGAVEAGRSGVRVEVLQPRPQQPDLLRLGAFLREMSVPMLPLSWDMGGQRQGHGEVTLASSGSSSGSDDGSNSEKSSNGCGTASPGNGETPLRSFYAPVQSSWVLEHWARVLLLGTAPALAGGDITQQQAAQAMQADLLHRCAEAHTAIGLDWSDFVGRPWGCTLAATHMAHLCAALDGGHAFGWPRPAMLLLPRMDPDDEALAGFDRFLPHDLDPARAARAVSLLPAALTLEAWASLQWDTLPDSAVQSVGAPLQAEGQSEAPVTTTASGVWAGVQDGSGTECKHEHQGAGGASTEGGSKEAGQAAGTGAETAETSPSGLPLLNRPATVAVSLRLARGMLAWWGGELPGVQLTSEDGSASPAAPLVPKAGGCALLHRALVCSRVALLPDVWGRERVPRRTRAQLREWWETYVAAAQHPEALLSGLQIPDWAPGETGVRPSADASAALAAGLLPCMTRVVTRFGAGRDEDATFWPAGLGPFGICQEDMLLHGPLGQVGDLVSAVGRRLHLAVEELRRAAVAGARGRKSVPDLLVIAYMVMGLASVLLEDVTSSMFAGLLPDGVGLEALQRTDGAKGTGEGGMEAAMAGAAGAGAVEVAPQLFAVRSSYAVAELLPPMSRGLQLCAEIVRGMRGGGAGWVCAVLDDVARGVRNAMDCTMALAAALCGEPGEEEQRQVSVNGGDVGGDDGTAYGSSGAYGGAAAGPSTVWLRQLLLGDVRVMELLGAAAELLLLMIRRELEPEEEGERHGMVDEDDVRSLLCALACAAGAFPAEFQAALGDGGAAGATGAGELVGADNRAAAAGGSSGASGTTACISVSVMRALLAFLDEEAELHPLTHALEGEVPTAQEVQELSSAYFKPQKLSRTLRMLLPPAEARAAVASAAAAAAAAPAVS